MREFLFPLGLALGFTIYALVYRRRKPSAEVDYWREKCRREAARLQAAERVVAVATDLVTHLRSSAALESRDASWNRKLDGLIHRVLLTLQIWRRTIARERTSLKAVVR